MPKVRSGLGHDLSHSWNKKDVRSTGNILGFTYWAFKVISSTKQGLQKRAGLKRPNAYGKYL